MSATMLSMFLAITLAFRQCYGNEYFDLSYYINEQSSYWPNGKPFAQKAVFRGLTDKGYWYESNDISMNEHTGTHLDAPSHFAKDKWAVGDIPLNHLMGSGVMIDLRDKVSKNSSSEFSAEDFNKWLDVHGPLPDGAIVLIWTGWDARYRSRRDYFGTDTTDTSNLIFPGVGTDVAQMLVDYQAKTGRRVFGVGLDTPSIDYGPSKDFKSHRILSEANIYILENVANMNVLPTTRFGLIVMPMKLSKGSGAPARILASIPTVTPNAQRLRSVIHNANQTSAPLNTLAVSMVMIFATLLQSIFNN